MMALANPHWPVWAACELTQPDPFALVPADWVSWIRKRKRRADRTGWSAPSSAT